VPGAVDKIICARSLRTEEQEPHQSDSQPLAITERLAVPEDARRFHVAFGSNPVTGAMSAARPLFHQKRKLINDLALSAVIRKIGNSLQSFPLE
jgi:hypothetical protein